MASSIYVNVQSALVILSFYLPKSCSWFWKKSHKNKSQVELIKYSIRLTTPVPIDWSKFVEVWLKIFVDANLGAGDVWPILAGAVVEGLELPKPGIKKSIPPEGCKCKRLSVLKLNNFGKWRQGKFTLKLYDEKNELYLDLVEFSLECRRKFKLAKLDLREVEPDKRPGLVELTNILEGCIVLSECLLPGRLPWTWSKLMSVLDDTFVRLITSSTETEVRRDSNRRHGGRCG